jgi:hypothetical protein
MTCSRLAMGLVYLTHESEAAHMNPIGIKQVDPAVRAELDPTATFPNESQSQR